MSSIKVNPKTTSNIKQTTNKKRETQQPKVTKNNDKKFNHYTIDR